MNNKKTGAALGILVAAILALYTLYFGASLPTLLEEQVLPEVDQEVSVQQNDSAPEPQPAPPAPSTDGTGSVPTEPDPSTGSEESASDAP